MNEQGTRNTLNPELIYQALYEAEADAFGPVALGVAARKRWSAGFTTMDIARRLGATEREATTGHLQSVFAVLTVLETAGRVFRKSGDRWLTAPDPKLAAMFSDDGDDDS